MSRDVARLGGGKAASRAARSSLSRVTSIGRDVGAHVVGVGGLRDRDDAGLAQHPGKRDGRRIAAVLVGDLLQWRLAQQRALAQRRVGHDHDLGLLALGQELPLDAARAQVIEHLVGGAVAAAGHAGELGHVAGVEVADAPVADLAVLAEGLEGLDRLGQRVGAAPVQEVEVEAVGLEALEAALAGGDGALARGVVGIDLADEVDVVAQGAHGVADDLLGLALAVHLGGVDEAQAELEAELHRLELGGPLGGALAHAPGAETQHRHLLTTLQRHRAHRQLLLPPLRPL